MKMKIVTIMMPLLLACLFWIGSLIYIEILTVRYGYEFEGLYQQTNMVVGMHEKRVLRYSANKARVYYFRLGSLGITLDFTKNDGIWKMESWDTIWSRGGGGADDFVWPFWHHSTEGIIIFAFLLTSILIIYAFIFRTLFKNHRPRSSSYQRTSDGKLDRTARR